MTRATTGLILIVAALGAALVSAAPAGATGQFSKIESGFTDELYGTTPGFIGGVAFAKNGDVYVDECAFGGSPLYRFNAAVTETVEGTKVHPQVEGSPFESNAGCGLTNNPDGFLYSNTSGGLAQLNDETAAYTGEISGPEGDALGAATDPQTGNIVYVTRTGGTEGVLYSVPAGGGAATVFSRATEGDFVDGIAFDPSGNFLFMSNRTLHVVTVINRKGEFVQNSAAIPGEPDGIAFHALSPKFVLTNNNDGTMTRLDFPGNDYTKTPTLTRFAEGGYRGDLAQVGSDGCLYLTQEGTRYDNGTESYTNSVVRVCPGFEPPPGVESEITLQPKNGSDAAGGEHTVTAMVSEGGTTPVIGAPVSFAITGQNAGVTGTCTTTGGAADPGCETDSTGGVRLTYKDEHGAGEDLIEASVTVKGSTQHATATETWTSNANTCTQAVGRARFKRGGEEGRLKVLNTLSIEPGFHNVMEVGFENGAVRFHLVKLEHATCTGNPGSRVFEGEGSAYKGTEKGFHVSFVFEEGDGGIYFEARVTRGETTEEVYGGPLLSLAPHGPISERIF